MRRFFEKLGFSGSVDNGWAAAFFIQLVFFGILAPLRLVAKDEGFYMLASELVSQGATPYLDFFYPQMPLLPYVYGAWMKFFGFSWVSARLFSALLTAAIGTLIYVLVREKSSPAFGALSVLLFASCCFVFPWFLTVQTYALSVFLLLGAYYLFERATEKSSSALLAFSGLAFGLSIDVRLFFGGLLPIFLYGLARNGTSFRVFCKDSLIFCIGMGIALLPNLYFLLAHFDNYFFNNLGYHMDRTSRDVLGEFANKRKVFKVVSGLDVSQKFSGFHS